MIAIRFGVESSSVAALIASAGVAIGLAVQGSISNFAGGILILLLKPFVVGDYIVVNGESLEGTVKEIQIFYTEACHRGQPESCCAEQYPDRKQSDQRDGKTGAPAGSQSRNFL